MLRNLPDDLKAEVLLDWLPEGSYTLDFRGMHGRNARRDLAGLEEGPDGTLHLGIGRNSLYHTLPEYMFHANDRFSHLEGPDEKERFAEERERQERERSVALAFFAPFDALLMETRRAVWHRISEEVSGNRILWRILGDRLPAEWQENRFIRSCMDFLVAAKQIRGNRTLLTWMLRKVMRQEDLVLEGRRVSVCLTDASPRYADGVPGEVGSLYAGNMYEAPVHRYEVHYWSEPDCDGDFLRFLEEVEAFRNFVQDYFLSVEEELAFWIGKDAAPLRLSDTECFNYLGYNTNL